MLMDKLLTCLQYKLSKH